MDFLLKNEFAVMAIDALLHLSSIVVLAVICVLACKLLTRGFVDAKLFTGLLIATLLVITRVFLLNNISRVLPGVGGGLLEILIIIGLFLTAFILVYKLVSIPALGTALSSAVIVFAQVSLAEYVPKLSLKLMPEGQRFAEYAGIANDRTKKLMNEAQAFRGKSGGIRQILADAAEAIKFFTSDEEQAQLSKDFASGIALYKARKEYMDNMSPEELAAYRKAMSEFLAEQGLAENRYSLSNLKNAKPEDLENLADFMKDMNEVYGFTDDMPERGERDDRDPEDLPSSAESLAQMAQSLSKVDMKSDEIAKLNSLFGELGINPDTVLAGMAQARDDLADIRDISSKMAGEFKRLIPEGMDVPNMGGGITDLNRDDMIVSGGYRIKKIPKTPTFSGSVFIEERTEDTAPSMVADEVTYYLPESATAIPGGDAEGTGFLAQTYSTLEPMDIPAPQDNYYDLKELTPISTEQSIFLVPKQAERIELWNAVSESVEIDAWFASAEEGGRSTIIIGGVGLKDGDILDHEYEGSTYRFRFKGIEDNLITLQALEHVSPEVADPPVAESNSVAPAWSSETRQ